MSGIGVTVARTVINAAIVLVIAALIISTIFVEQGYMHLKGMALEMFQAKIRALERQGVKITPELRESINRSIYERLGLTRPKHERIVLFMIRAITFSFEDFQARVNYPGTTEKNAKAVILAALRPTIILFTTATFINIFLGIFLGLQAARKAGKLLDRGLSTVAMISASLPMWWVGMLMLLIFSFTLKLFPFASIDIFNELNQLEKQYAGLELFFRSIPLWFKYMTLPLITVTLVSFGGWAYIIRNVVFTVMSEDFVYVARAKGLSERSVLYKHVLRTASPPIVTMSAMSIVGSLGGAIITETVFQWPGMGRAYWVALQNGDTGVLIAITYTLVFLFVITIVLLDFIYMMLDPRVRVGGVGR